MILEIVGGNIQKERRVVGGLRGIEWLLNAGSGAITNIADLAARERR